jgi:hypothetical protein
MPRAAWIITVALLVVAPVAIWWIGQRADTTAAPTPAILLGNMPPKNCPTAAEIVVTKDGEAGPLQEGMVEVKSCSLIELDTSMFGRSGTYNFYVALPTARPLVVTVAGPVQGYVDATLQFGDVDGNFVIDRNDQRQVESALAGQSIVEGADVDNDGTVTVLDYALVTLNQGAGVSRPDGRPWSIR